MNLSGRLKKRIRAFVDLPVYWRSQLSAFFRKFVKEQHQLTSVTSSDRYPDLFKEVHSILGSNPTPSILSFGCSTGEECATILSYFPRANILGVDINKNNLRKARRRVKHDNVKFLFSTPETILKHGKQDLIFCLSVLCRWEETKDLESCADIYPFTKFSQTVTMLANQVKKGGLLVIYNSNFRFEDTEASKGFSIVSTPSIADSGFVHKFDSSNKRLKNIHKHCVYQKN